jgi:hypothetical protein
MPYKVTLVGAQAHEQTPVIAVYAVDARGRVGNKIAAVANGQLYLPTDRTAVVAFGPDVAEASTLDPKGLVTLRLADQLPIWDRNNEILLPPNWWRGWLGFEICVNGNTYRCFPVFLDRDTLRAIGLGLLPSVIYGNCQPLCDATVEIWRSTTCCWPFLITDVPKLIANLSAFLQANPVMFPPLPSPGPVERSLASRVDAALGAGKISTSFVPSPTLAAHLQTLESLTPQDAVNYIETYPSLWPFWCDTSSEYLGETAVNPDGSFSFCYSYYPFFLFNCRTSYFYKVKQYVNGAWQYIYDGAAANQYFSADDVADVYAQTGQLCYQPPILPAGTATLQQIGFIPAYDFNSHWVTTPTSGPLAGIDQTQLGDGVMAPLPLQNAGLGLADGAPWTQTISIMLNFDPALKTMQTGGTSGAYYYRLSTVQADPSRSGKPISGATPQPITNAVAWNYQDDTVSPPVTRTMLLGPNTEGTQSGLFIIPYAGDRNWFGNADNTGFYHQTLDTTTLANAITNGPGQGNGQFLLILELFDNSGNRLVPTGTGTKTGDVDADFTFVRLIAAPPVTPPALTDAIVNFPSLTHVIWVDNRPVVADIVNFQSSSGTQVCQTLTAAASAQFTVGYQAYHTVMCDGGGSPVPATTFISSYAISWEKGLGGGTGFLVEANENSVPDNIPPPLMNAPTNCPAGANSVSTSAVDNPLAADNTFGNLLGTDTFCAFSIQLSAQPKHTNGFNTVGAVVNTAAVALSIG